MATRNSNIRPRLAAKLLLPAALGIMLLAACGALNKPSAKAPTKATGATEEKTATGELTFPQATCGEEASTPSENWYPVFIDGAELSAIRSQYCGNAVSEVRSKTGAPTVQVASFTSYEKAKRFAAAVGGEVDVVGSALGVKPESDQARSPQQELATGKTATLASAETGSPINIRQSASTDASVQEVAYSGDEIKVASKTQGADGYTWYKVELNSGASGWVRSDLISTTTGTASSTTASNTTGSTTGSSTTSTTGSTARGTASPTTSTASTTIASAPPSTAASAPSSTSTTAASTRSTSSSTTASSGRTATIATSDPGSPINVRSGAGTDAEVQDVAYGGDRIQITDTQQGDDGQTWYKVQFESGSSGWVRGDFIGK